MKMTNNVKLCLVLMTYLGMLTISTASSWGQGLRYELGTRLRAFERQFETLNTPQQRGVALPDLTSAVNSFFSLQLQSAAKQLDQARVAITPAPHQELLRKTINLQLIAPNRIIDKKSSSTNYELKKFYGDENWDSLTWNWFLYPTIQLPATDRIAEPQNELAGARSSGQPMTAKAVRSELPMLTGTKQALDSATTRTITITPQDLTSGDYHLVVRVYDAENLSIELLHCLISIVDQPQQRIEKLKQQLLELPPQVDKTQKASLRFNLQMVAQRWQKQSQEMDLPANRILNECERMMASLVSGQKGYVDRRPAEVWLSIVTAGGEVPVRMAIPAPAENEVPRKPLPLVLALHGAGGSENMFFDGYGDGKVVRMALERGWLIAAPRVGSGGRSSDLDELIEELDRIYPVDRERVMLVGHSMGAGQAIAFVAGAQKKPIAVAALGGGNRVRDVEPFRGINYLIAAGAEDFGRRGAVAFYESLQKAGIECEYREWESVEHLAIVQVALEDVFQFFDQHANNRDSDDQ